MTITIEEARAIIADFHARKIKMYDTRYDKWIYTSVKQIIPMRNYEDSDISDVEILTKRKNNQYFSIKCIKENRSWVKDVLILDEKDARLIEGGKYPPVLDNWQAIQTAKFLKELL
jgi:hypothetical protein